MVALIMLCNYGLSLYSLGIIRYCLLSYINPVWSFDLYGFYRITMVIHGYPWLSMVIHGYHGYVIGITPCWRNSLMAIHIPEGVSPRHYRTLLSDYLIYPWLSMVITLNDIHNSLGLWNF